MKGITIVKRVVIAVIASVALLTAYWVYGTVTTTNDHDASVTTCGDVFSLLDIRNKKDGWATYSVDSIDGGSWYGGILKDGTITSCAQSSTKKTRVYTKNGAWDRKHWSGWLEVGEKNMRQSSATLGTFGAIVFGTWYGYEVE